MMNNRTMGISTLPGTAWPSWPLPAPRTHSMRSRWPPPSVFVSGAISGSGRAAAF